MFVFFPPFHDRFAPGGRDCTGRWLGAGAIAAGRCPGGDAGPGTLGKPGSGGEPLSRPCEPASGRREPGATGGRGGSDRRSLGEEIMLAPKTVVIRKGTANWDAAFDALIDSFKSLSALLDKQGIKPTGNPMIVYTSTDDTGFTYMAEIPVDQDPKNLAKDMSMGKSPDGKALKFVHRGSYDNMDNTYEAITNHLDDKKLEAKDTFIEEYITDPLKTAEDKLVINVYVPLK
jgi:effector-binding domain-containing protein